MIRFCLPVWFVSISLPANGIAADAPPKKHPSPALHKGLDYLAKSQVKDGSFDPNRFGRRYRRGITGICVLALLNSNDEKYHASARKGLQYLAENQQPGSMYSHAFATLALCEGAIRWKMDFYKPADQALQTVVKSQNQNGGWGYAANPRSSRTESCMAGLMLHALFSARKAGLDVPDKTVKDARAFLHKQYVAKRKMFNNETYPSPSYGATGWAVAALEQWGGGKSKPVLGALEYLDEQSLDRLTANLKGRPFSGYMRGHFHFELLAHALAYHHASDPKLMQKWYPKIRASLAKQISDDGSWDGWFGKPYGTAIVCLILQMDQWPRLAWLDRQKTP